jgi:hypothetical protein
VHYINHASELVRPTIDAWSFARVVEGGTLVALRIHAICLMRAAVNTRSLSCPNIVRREVSFELLSKSWFRSLCKQLQLPNICKFYISPACIEPYTALENCILNLLN